MGQDGQLSRIQNTFLTPVSHPLLPSKAAPGQLSAAEIRTALSLHGVIKPRYYYLFGKPISQSRSPALHNSLFKETGLPHTYGLLETDRVVELEKAVTSNDFGGASVTIPLKSDVRIYLDEVSEDALTIGAVNTIIADKFRWSRRHLGRHLLGRNTDWQGMRLVLTNASGDTVGHGSGLVIGGGGTSRAAIYALHAIGHSPIYVLGRCESKLKNLVESFPQGYNLKLMIVSDDYKEAQPPSVAISTIPADQPIDEGMKEVLKDTIFRTGERSVLLEMAYKPAVTPFMELATAAGWTIISGAEVIAAQGLFQFEAWTGITPTFKRARDIVMGS